MNDRDAYRREMMERLDKQAAPSSNQCHTAERRMRDSLPCPWCVIDELKRNRDSLSGQLDAAERHVRILQEQVQSFSHETTTELLNCGPGTPWDRLCGEPSCTYCGARTPDDMRALFNKGIGVLKDNRFSFSFENDEEAERAFHYIADLGTLQTSQPPQHPKTGCFDPRTGIKKEPQ